MRTASSLLLACTAWLLLAAAAVLAQVQETYSSNAIPISVRATHHAHSDTLPKALSPCV